MTNYMTYIHPTSEIEADVEIGSRTKIWQICQIRPRVHIGSECVLGRGVFVDSDVKIGDRVKIQNYVSVFHGVTIQDGVFIGPHVCFTNDLKPRAINPDGSLKSADDWTVSETLVKRGASIGANATIVCGITIGEWAMIGSGSVVCKDVPDHALVVGNPAHIIGWVTASGRKVLSLDEARQQTALEVQNKQ